MTGKVRASESPLVGRLGKASAGYRGIYRGREFQRMDHYPQKNPRNETAHGPDAPLGPCWTNRRYARGSGSANTLYSRLSGINAARRDLGNLAWRPSMA